MTRQFILSARARGTLNADQPRIRCVYMYICVCIYILFSIYRALRFLARFLSNPEFYRADGRVICARWRRDGREKKGERWMEAGTGRCAAVCSFISLQVVARLGCH